MFKKKRKYFQFIIFNLFKECVFGYIVYIGQGRKKIIVKLVCLFRGI